MTQYEFDHLPNEHQLELALQHATYVARRWEEECAVNLYHVDGRDRGFFVEVYYNPDTNALGRVRSVSRAAPLEAYAVYVRLPEDLT